MTDRPTRAKGRVRGAPYDVAMAAHKAGDKVRRRAWPDGMVLISSTYAKRGSDLYVVTIQDCTATDWEMIDG